MNDEQISADHKALIDKVYAAVAEVLHDGQGELHFNVFWVMPPLRDDGKVEVFETGNLNKEQREQMVEIMSNNNNGSYLVRVQR